MESRFEVYGTYFKVVEVLAYWCLSVVRKRLLYEQASDIEIYKWDIVSTQALHVLRVGYFINTFANYTA